MINPRTTPLKWTVLLVCGLVWASSAAADIESDLRNVLQSANLGSTRVSVFVQDAQTGEVLAEIDADRMMVPASNLKLVTTAAALAVLGPEFAFETTLLQLPFDPNTGEARLAIVGGGDPAFGDPVLLARLENQINEDRPDEKLIALNPGVILDDWADDTAQHLREQGSPRVAPLLIDDRIFDREFIHPHWPEDQLDFYYCAQVGGINFYNNIIDITAVPERSGQAPRVRLYPLAPTVDTRNLAKTGRTQGFWIDRKPQTNALTFRGTLKHSIDTPVKITTHDPPIYLGELLRDELGERGIMLDRVERVQPQQPKLQGEVLERFRTTLPWIIDRTNQDSHNLFAEALFKRLGYELTGAPGSFENGSAAVRQFLSRRLAQQVRTAGVQIDDGSGLSHANLISTRILSALLVSMHRDEALAEIYRLSLAKAGDNGSLRHRLQKDITGVCFAKTGYIARKVDGQNVSASGLSGYLVMPAGEDGEPGRTIAFSMLFNDFKPQFSNRRIKAVQDQMVRAMDQELVRLAQPVPALTR